MYAGLWIYCTRLITACQMSPSVPFLTLILWHVELAKWICLLIQVRRHVLLTEGNQFYSHVTWMWQPWILYLCSQQTRIWPFDFEENPRSPRMSCTLTNECVGSDGVMKTRQGMCWDCCILYLVELIFTVTLFPSPICLFSPPVSWHEMLKL